MSDDVFDLYITRDEFFADLEKVCARVDKSRTTTPPQRATEDVCPSCGDLAFLDEINGWCRSCVKERAA